MKKSILILLAAALVIAGGISYFASPSPDGLERVAEDAGFLGRAIEPMFTILPDYTVPGLPAALSNGLAGIIGTLATFGVAFLLGRAVRSRKRGDVARDL